MLPVWMMVSVPPLMGVSPVAAVAWPPALVVAVPPPVASVVVAVASVVVPAVEAGVLVLAASSSSSSSPPPQAARKAVMTGSDRPRAKPRRMTSRRESCRPVSSKSSSFLLSRSDFGERLIFVLSAMVTAPPQVHTVADHAPPTTCCRTDYLNASYDSPRRRVWQGSRGIFPTVWLGGVASGVSTTDALT